MSLPQYPTLGAWIAAAIPLSFDAPESLDAAVDALASALDPAVELLGFGEALHCGEEILLLRNRLFARLAEAHGFSAIAFESSFQRARLVDEYVAGGGPGSYEAVQEAGWSHTFGQLDANRELVEWMRARNADTAHGLKLRFYGFDGPLEMMGAESPRQLLGQALEFLGSADPAAGERFHRQIEPLLGDESAWQNPGAMFDPSLSVGGSPSAAALRIVTEELIAELRVRRPELLAASQPGHLADALHCAAQARQLLNYHAAVARPAPNRTAWLLGLRDALMADNLAYIVERERGRGKVLVFAHNSHLQRSPARWQLGSELLTWWPAGAHMHTLLGPRYAVVGTAVGWSEQNGIGRPEPGTLEAQLAAAPGPMRLLPTYRGQGLPAAEIAALPTRTTGAVNTSYTTPLGPQSFADFDWLAALDSVGYARGGPPLARRCRRCARWSRRRQRRRAEAFARESRDARNSCMRMLRPYVVIIETHPPPHRVQYAHTNGHNRKDATMTTSSEAGWPVLRRYDAAHLARVAMPLGGIGTGTVSLGGRGDLRDWELVNRPAKGFAPPNSFFALRAKPAGAPAVALLLEGPLDAADFQGPLGSTARNHGLPRFRECEFAAAYPLGQVLLSDPDMPLRVRLEAFNPLVPGDSETSGMPFAALRFVLTNPGRAPVAASVVATLQNFIGTDGAEGTPSRNVNTFRESAGLRGIALESRGVDPAAPQWGTLALATTAEQVTYRSAWARLSWGDTLLDFWDDFTADGRLDERAADGEDAPVAALAAELDVPGGETRAVTFLLAWHFPNRQSWTPGGQGAWLQLGACASGAPTIGNFYTTQFADAWDAAERAAARLEALEDATVRFVRVFCASDMPAEAQEAALFNLSTLRSQTCFRTPDGRFWGWEGCFDHHGSCYGSCTHVWNYEQATAHLFGDLARSMREVEFAHATRDSGFMSFRVHLPLEHAQAGDVAAADGQMGCIMKLYRDWQLAGDDAFLRSLWPKARKALEFCWIPGGWDADRDGVMEGCQHNTMDVEYYGPNPEMGFWYLGALRAAEEMARHLGEAEFADTCAGLFARGRAWVERHLFNGEYYEHEIRPIREAAQIAPGLRHAELGARDLSDPELQLGAGCLTDQLVGQLMAHVCGLGYLADPEQIRSALASIVRYNFRQELHGHFNHLRTYALADEPGLLVASYPLGRRPTRPFPYCNEVWTGLEYTAAAHLLYEGRREDGLRVIAAVRSRFEGARRSPFDEAECGHHYARAMASWAAVLALSGFHYSGVTGALAFAGADRPQQVFWSNGAAWGSCAQTPTAGGVAVELAVLQGQLRVAQLRLAGVGSVAFDTPRTLGTGERLAVEVPRGAGA